MATGTTKRFGMEICDLNLHSKKFYFNVFTQITSDNTLIACNLYYLTFECVSSVYDAAIDIHGR